MFRDGILTRSNSRDGCNGVHVVSIASKEFEKVYDIEVLEGDKALFVINGGLLVHNSAFTLVDKLKVSREEAEEFLRFHRKRLLKLMQWFVNMLVIGLVMSVSYVSFMIHI
jgi:hypothetical protein